MPDALQLVAARRAKLTETVTALKFRLTKAEDDLRRLNEAAEVLLQLLKDEGDYLPMLEPDAAPANDATNKGTDEPKGKPPGTPPMSEMILEALETTHRMGGPGLQPTGMASFIQGRYWRGAEVTNVGPIAWRMWKRSQIGKEGSIYFRVDRARLYPSHPELEGDLAEVNLDRIVTDANVRAPTDITEGAR